MFQTRNKKRIFKGSIAVFSLILMLVLALTTISIIATAAIERKVSISTGNSTTAFQIAESGMEKTLQFFKSNFDKTLNDINGASNCKPGGIVEYSSNEKIRFRDNIDPPDDYITNCGALISSVKIIKSIGTTKQETRAIEEDVFLGATKLLLHLDGPTEDGKFTDSSFYYNNHPIEDYGGVRASTKDTAPEPPDFTEPYKFGASTYFDGVDDYLSTSDSIDWDFGTGDFTVDFWVRPGEGSQAIPNQTYIDIGSSSTTLLKINQASSTSLCVKSMTFDACWNISQMDESEPDDTDMYHIVVVRKASEDRIKLFINGASQGDKPFDMTVEEDLTGEAVYIGSSHDSADKPFWGFMDELRISKGVARWWNSNFTPPTSAYWPD